MVSKSSLAVLFIVLLVIPSFAEAEKRGRVGLGMLDNSLAKAEGTAVDAFKHKENRIEFDQPGVEKYDEFFKKVAVVSGTVTELRFVLDEFNKGKVGPLDAKPVIGFGLKALPKLEDRIPALIDQAQAFEPVDDFPGFRNKMKVPAVTAGVANASKTLTEAAREVPELLEELKATAGMMGL